MSLTYSIIGMLDFKGSFTAAQKNTDIKCQPDNPGTSMPVVIATGEKYKSESDFSTGSQYGFSLGRTYRSKQAVGTLFGPNWLSSIDVPTLKFTFSGCIKMPNGDCVPHSIVFVDSSGAEFTYTRGAYEGEHEHPYIGRDGSFILYEYGQSWTLYGNQGTYRYSNSGKILSASENLRSPRTYTYDPNTGRLSQIANEAGHAVHLAWSNGRVSQVTDPDGKVWTYGYNGNNMLAKVTSPGGADIRDYHYEDSDPTLLTGISINGVRHSTYRYDANKRVIESGLAGGETVDKFVYGTDYTEVTDARGQRNKFTFITVQGDKKVSEISRSVTSTCAAAAAKTFYDANGFIDYTVDWNQTKTDYTFSSAGRLLSVTKAAGTSVALTTAYTWTGNDVTYIAYRDASNVLYAETTHTYHTSGLATGRLLSTVTTDKITNLSQRVDYEYGFHPNGVIASASIKQTVPEGLAITTISYDARGNILSTRNPLHQTESWSDYNGRGQAGTYIDVNGSHSSYEYFPNGSLSTITQSGSRVTRFTYNNDRQITSVTFPSGRVKSYQYNAAGRLESVRNALDEPVHYGVQITNNSETTSSERKLPSISGSTLAGTTGGTFNSNTQLDSLGRAYTSLGNNSQRVDYRYDGNGNLRSRTDAANRVTLYEYDAQNRLKSATAPDGGTTRLEYTPAGQLQAIVDPRSLRTSYEYNGFGGRTRLTSPDTGVTNYIYDTAGRLKSETRQDGKTISYTWDLLGRMLTRTSGTTTETFTYDEGSYGKGRLTRFNDATGQTIYTYNEAGQLVAQANTVHGQVFNTTWSYDSAGRLVGMTYPTGLALIFSYDAYGRVSAVKTSATLHN